MDHFGIGQAMRGIARVFFQSARQSGRTTSLIESVKDGDRIVCATSKEVPRLQQLCRERGLSVECIVIDPRTPERIFQRGTPTGRSIFEHTWVEQYYMASLERAEKDIDQLQKQASGFGAAHLETRRAAQELAQRYY